LCFRWLSPFFKQVQKGFIRSAQVQSIISLHVVWVHFQFIGFPDESVHVSSFCEKKFLYLLAVPIRTILLNYIIKLRVLSHINHDHVSIAFAIIIRVTLQEYLKYRKLPNWISGTTERYDRCHITTYRIIYHIIYHISYHIISYITYHIIYHISYHIISYITYHILYIISHILYHIISYHIIS